jgi:hypothetical protein
VGLRDGGQGFVCRHRQGATAVRLATALLQPRGAPAQLRVVHRQPGPLLRRGRDQPPGSLEAGRPRPAQARPFRPPSVVGSASTVSVRA